MANTMAQPELSRTAVHEGSGILGRTAALLYGIAAYAVFLVSLLYAIGFVGNFIVPKSIDTGAPVPLGEALVVNSLLLTAFALQHSIMARAWFKRAWTKVVPKSIERSTFVLFASSILLVLYWQWRPMTATVWSIENPVGRGAVQAVQLLGWLIVFLGTFMINHFDLFGLRQVVLNLRNQPYRDLGFRTPFFYKFVRHPIMLGFIIAFWAAPVMTAGHLLFAVATTAFIVVAIQFEERDLVKHFGEEYEDYRRRTPGFLPRAR